MVTLIVALLFAASLSLLPGPASDIPPEEISPTPARTAYDVHVPISIDGNAEFNHTNFPNNGVVSGNGSASNPYIIEGWNINVGGGPVDGIRIQNTNAYFIVRDCYVHNGGNFYNGVNLTTCVNGILDNNTCLNNQYGIFLTSASNNTVSNNICNSNVFHGIYLVLSSSNALTNNNCSSNSQVGIWLSASTGNTIKNNSCLSNPAGMRLQTSSNSNTLSDNNCSSNNLYGIGLYSSSNNNTLSNNTCNSNTQYGMRLATSSSNNIISNNICNLNTQNGMRLSASSSNVISWNEVCNNTLQGVYIVSGSTNRIWNNTFIGNNGGGIQAQQDTGTNWWNTSGTPHGYGNYWSDWTTPDADFDGIVDWSYNLTGVAGAKDWYPLTTSFPPIPEFSELIIPIVGLMLIALIFNRAREKP